MGNARGLNGFIIVAHFFFVGLTAILPRCSEVYLDIII